MNPNQTALGNLANGIFVQQCTPPAVVVQQVAPAPVVTNTGCSTNAFAIDTTCLTKNSDGKITLTLTNMTGAAQIVVFGIFGEVGDFLFPAALTNPNPAFQDFITATGDGPIPDGNGGVKLASLNRMLQSVALLIRTITIVASNPIQGRNPWIQSTINLNLNDSCQNQIASAICNQCVNSGNGDNNQFTSVFNCGPYPLGLLDQGGYKINDGQTVEIQFDVMARQVASYVAVASGNCGPCAVNYGV